MISEKRRRAALVRWLARLGLGLALVLAGLYAYAETPGGRRRLRETLAEVIRDQLGLEAELRYVRLQPTMLPPGVAVVARGISLRHPSEGRLVEATRLEVRPSLTRLLLGRVELTRIELRRPSVRLVLRDGKLVNGPTLPPSGDEPAPLPFSRIAIEDASVHVYTDQGVSGALLDIDAEADVHGGRALTVDLRSSGGTVRHPRGVEPVSALRVAGMVDLDLGVHLDRVDVALATAHLTLRDANLPLPYAERASAQVALDVDVTRLGRTLAQDLGVSLEGGLLVRGDVRYDQGHLAGSARLLLDSVAIRQRGLGEPLELDVTYTEREVRIDRGVLHVPHEGGEVGLTGTVGLAAPYPVDVALDFRHMQLAALLDDLGITPNAIARWTFDGPAELRGQITPFELNGPIDVETTDFFVSMGPWHQLPRERIMGVERGHIRGRVHIDDEALQFLDLDVVTDHSRIRADTTISFGSTFSVHAVSEHLDLADISPLTTFPLTGAGPIDVTVGGDYSNPALDARFDLHGFSFDGMPLGDLQGNADFEQGGMVAHFPLIHAVHGDSRYAVRDLRLDFTQELEVDAEVELTDVVLADVYRTFHLDEDQRFDGYHGRAVGRAHAHFTYGFPGDGPTGTVITQFDLALRDLDITGYAFETGTFLGELRWYDQNAGFDGAELDIDEFILHKGRGTVAVSGEIGREGALDLSVVADRIAIEDTEGIRESFPLLTGEYGVVGRVGNDLETPRMDLDLNVANVQWAGRTLGGGRTYVKLTDQSDPYVAALRGMSERELANEPCVHGRSALLHADWPADPPLRTPEGMVPALAHPEAFLICGEGLGGALDIDVALGWTHVSPHRGRIRMVGLDLAPFLPAAPDGGAATGALTATLDLESGDVRTDRTTGGSLQVDAFDVAVGGVRLASAAPFLVTLARGSAKIAGAELIGDSTALRLSGSMSATELGLALEGSVGMDLFAAATPLLADATGSTDLRLLIRGPITNPEVVGEALFAGVGFTNDALPVPVTDISGRVEFSERRVVLDAIRGRLGEGRFAIEGSAAIDAGSPSSFDIHTTLTDVALRPEDGIEVAFGGDLMVTWDVTRDLPLVRGRLDLGRVRYTRPVSFTPTLGQLQGPTRVEVDDYDPEAEWVDLDIEVTQRAPAEIRNDLVDLDIRIEDDERPFRIVGTNERPGVIGTLSIPRGVVNFRGTSFDVRRGTIELAERNRIEPRFDVLATTDVRRAYDSTAPAYRIQLGATGTFDQFRLDASSTPSLSQQDIMLLLVVGMTSSELQNLQASQLSTTALDAISSLTGVSDRLSDAVRVIDEVSLTTMYHPVTNRPEPQLTVGTRVTDRIRVTASTGLTTETRSVRAAAQFRIDEHTSLQAGYDNLNRETASTFGNVGVDMRYRLEFE